MGLPLPSLSSPLGGLGLGVLPQSGGASATITSYNITTGVVSGSAPPGLIVVISISGAYATNVMSDSKGNWTASLGPGNTVRTLSVAAIPVGNFIAGAALFSAFDPNNISTNVVLSSNNTVSSTTSAGAGGYSRGVAGRNSGLLYMEAKLLTGITGVNATTSFVFGVANASQALGNVQPDDTNGLYLYDGGGGQYVRGTKIASGLISSGDVIGIAVNFTARIAYFIGSQAGTTSSYTLPSGTLYPMLCLSQPGYAALLNTGQSSFQFTMPSGYSVWN